MTTTPPAHRLTTIALAVGVVVAACGGGGDGGGGDGDGSSAAGADAAAVDVDAAAGRLSQYAYETVDGADATLADFAGTPLVLNFFASWCGPCEAEMPDLEEAALAVGDDVTFFGLLVRDSVEAGQAMVDRTGITYGWGVDTHDVLIDFDGIGMPTTVFIAADGEVLDSHVGPLSAEQLRDKLGEHFGVEVA